MSLCAWGRVSAISLLIVLSSLVFADSLSFTGNLSSPSSPVIQPFTVSTAGTFTIQTWGFGGGTNAAGTLINPGGIDPLIAIFSGVGPSASIFNIGGDPNNPAGTSDTLSNYVSFMGCPPAGLVTIGAGAGSSVCGDIKMVLSLSVGTYTLVVGDAVPGAVLPKFQPMVWLIPDKLARARNDNSSTDRSVDVFLIKNV